MERATLERIEELAVGGLINDNVDIPAMVLPAGNKIASLEHLQDAPYRQRVHFRTERLPDWTAYVKHEHSEQSVVFVQPDGSGATAVIDFGMNGEPCWKEHKATLAMRTTAEYQAMLGITQQPVTQRELTDWIEDWQHVVKPLFGQAEQSISHAITAIRKVEIKAGKQKTHEEGDFRAARTSLESIEAASGAGQLPDRFRFPCQMYPHTKARDFALRLALLTGHDKPMFQVRLLAAEWHKQEVAEEVELEIFTRLNSEHAAKSLRIFVGTAD